MNSTPNRAGLLVSSVKEVNATVALTILTGLAYLLPLDPLAQGTRVLGPLLVFGATATSLLKGALSLTQRIGLVLCLGLGVTLLTGAFEAVMLTHLGLARPLAGLPLGAALVLLQVSCAIWSSVKRADPLRVCFAGARTRHWIWALALASLSLLSLVGMERANLAGSVVVSIIAGVIVLALVVAAIALPESRWAPPKVLMLATAVLMAGWQVPLRGGWLVGGDLPHEYFTATLALSQGRFPLRGFTDTYGGMLSLTVWPAQWHAVAGLSLLTIFGFLPEVALACCVLVSWGTVRERVGARTAAAICALFVVAAPDLVSVLPEVSRQCYAILFLAVLVFSISSIRLSTNSARFLAVAAMVGIAITHYSTAFIAAAIVVASAGLSYLLRTPRRQRVLTLPVVGGVAAVVVLWDVLFDRANSNLNQVVSTLSRVGTQKPGGPKPIIRPGIRCTSTGAPTTSFTSLPMGAPRGGRELLAASVVPQATVAPGLATWALAAVVVILGAVLIYVAWRLVRNRGDAESRRTIKSVSLVTVVMAGTAALVLSVTHGWARVVGSPFRAFVDSPSGTSIADASKVRTDDLQALTHLDNWMRLATGSCGTKLTSFAPTTAKGVFALSSIAGVIERLASKGLILCAIASVFVCLGAALKDRRLVGLAGMGVAAVGAAAAWKFVPAMSQFFGTDRIEIETYFVFAATSAAALEQVNTWRLEARAEARAEARPEARTGPGRAVGWAGVGLVAAVVLAGSMGLINRVTAGRPLDAAFSTQGQQIDLAAAPAELPAAQWLARSRPTGVVQADFTSLGALGSISDDFDLIVSVDPVLTDTSSWVFASRTNLVQGRGYGGSTTYKAAFRFPETFLQATRSTLFVSSGAVIYGSVVPPRL